MKIIDYKTDREIQSAGYEYLREGLGATGLIRFMQQCEKGKGNYTQDRSLWQKDYFVDDLALGIKTRKSD
ncbi:hypothetical protein ACMCNP_04945 [Candidatus Acidulodesulfobacterium sp. H_13]|uniref:hypothetical protein n=1 Tax=Candidatus Acidulodesulfobacterium sp. H_13 TaxID=3395470 RepID=UPI003AF77E51